MARRQVLELVRAGKRVNQLAATFQMSDATIYNWLKQDRIDRGEAEGATTSREEGSSVGATAHEHLVAIGITATLARRDPFRCRALARPWPTCVNRRTARQPPGTGTAKAIARPTALVLHGLRGPRIFEPERWIVRGRPPVGV